MENKPTVFGFFPVNNEIVENSKENVKEAGSGFIARMEYRKVILYI